MHKNNLIVAFTFLVCVFWLTSCSTIFTKLYGIKKIKTVDENTILRYSRKYNIPITDTYQIETSYRSFLSSIDSTLNTSQINNHHQPLQALYFDHTGQLQSFQVNCYAGGFPNLKWNRDGIMSTFPPKQQAPLDSILTLKTQLKYLKPISNSTKTSTDDAEYFVIVYWSKFMGRQSKRLIRYVQNNSKLETRKIVKIIYVNTDNLFAPQ